MMPSHFILFVIHYLYTDSDRFIVIIRGRTNEIHLKFRTFANFIEMPHYICYDFVVVHLEYGRVLTCECQIHWATNQPTNKLTKQSTCRTFWWCIAYIWIKMCGLIIFHDFSLINDECFRCCRRRRCCCCCCCCCCSCLNQQNKTTKQTNIEHHHHRDNILME